MDVKWCFNASWRLKGLRVKYSIHFLIILIYVFQCRNPTNKIKIHKHSGKGGPRPHHKRHICKMIRWGGYVVHAGVPGSNTADPPWRNILVSPFNMPRQLETHHLISGGGGGPGKKLKKIVCHHKSQKKKFVENVSRKKKFVVKNDEKYVDQKKKQMVTYIIGKAYHKKCLRRDIKKNCRTLIAKKKDCFLSEVKKKFASNKNSSPPPPPQISNGASLNGGLSEPNPCAAELFVSIFHSLKMTQNMRIYEKLSTVNIYHKLFYGF